MCCKIEESFFTLSYHVDQNPKADCESTSCADVGAYVK